jgi:Na+/proline symporter
VLYLVLMVAIGVATSRASSSGLASFFQANRALGKVVVALSAVASGRSGWLLLGFPGLAFARGASVIRAAAGYVVVEAAVFWSLGRRLRRFSAARDCLTVPDVLAARAGLVAGVVVGTIKVVVWSLVPERKSAVYELIPAWIAGATAIVVTSLATRPEPDAAAAIRDLDAA